MCIFVGIIKGKLKKENHTYICRGKKCQDHRGTYPCLPRSWGCGAFVSMLMNFLGHERTNQVVCVVEVRPARSSTDGPCAGTSSKASGSSVYFCILLIRSAPKSYSFGPGREVPAPFILQAASKKNHNDQRQQGKNAENSKSMGKKNAGPSKKCVCM